MSEKIRSALDIALEKIAALDDATEEDRLKWKYTPIGEQIGVKLLRDEVNIADSFAQYSAGALFYLRKGVENVLLDNIQLPVNDTINERNTRALSNLPVIKNDKTTTIKLVEQIKQVLGHYRDQGQTQRRDAREQLKQRYSMKLKQAVKKQYGSLSEEHSMGIDVEKLPQFQEEWRKTEVEMDMQYLNLLDEFKNELRRID